jgi:hypothetical protein
VTNADWAALEADAVRLAEAEKRRSERMAALGLEPLAPQRFWRLLHNLEGWWTLSVARADDLGPVISGPHPTRAEAEADGHASGLPEWPGGKR